MAGLEDVRHPGAKPKVVVLSGSTRFHKRMHAVALEETLAGRIVLVVGSDDKSDDEMDLDDEDRKRLCDLHKHKIDMADEMLVVNVDGYVGESTADEIRYAESLGMKVRYVE